MTWLLVLAGLAAGPGYYLYSRYLTGALVAQYPLATLAGQGLGVARQSPDIRLDPGMSPVRFIVHLSSHHGPSPQGAPRNRHRAVVLHDGTLVAESAFELVSTTIEASFQEHAEVVATVAVAEPGVYRLALEDTAEPEMSVTSVRLEVRRNVRDPDMRVVWSGAALLALGLARLLFGR